MVFGLIKEQAFSLLAGQTIETSVLNSLRSAYSRGTLTCAARESGTAVLTEIDFISDAEA